MPTFTAPIPRPRCSCTGLYYDDDCPQHGRMFGAWCSRRELEKVKAAKDAPPPAPVYPLVKLWLWMERISAGLRK